MIADQLVAAIEARTVLPGDAVIYRYASVSPWISPVQWGIANVQRRALADLGAPVGVVPNPHLFTHAGMVLDATRTVEMTSPRCRVIDWETRLKGIAEIVVVRPVHADPSRLAEAARLALAEARRGTRYPYREIVLYWLWSWGWRKLRGHTPFSVVFRDRTRNVCSGSLIQWWQVAGIELDLGGTDAWPEAWYPARLLVEPAKFQIVAVLDGHETHKQHEEG